MPVSFKVYLFHCVMCVCAAATVATSATLTYRYRRIPRRQNPRSWSPKARSKSWLSRPPPADGTDAPLWRCRSSEAESPVGTKEPSIEGLIPVTVLILGVEGLLLDGAGRPRQNLERPMQECGQPFYLISKMPEGRVSDALGGSQMLEGKGDFQATSPRIYGILRCGKKKETGLLDIQKRAPKNARFVYIDADVCALREAARVPELREWELFLPDFTLGKGVDTVLGPRITLVNMAELCEILKTGAPCGQIWDTYLPGHDHVESGERPADKVSVG
eukprot:CAMPEP_0114500488 /NCGR_PEP_ID=MMETSP0109-20121206/7993_1 /TAXON_ID=29199 /ORGANISM="Chlorarachnion reptans, Strain CCCM449" /LENGTH=274 /DNA_ID=CAMNT_0001678157 /DNA_START=183 /DNA_END=1007 /DNA_ORIENTATION=-